MPKGFDDCVKAGGRVRRLSGPNKEHGLKAGEYVNYCFLKGKSYRGEVKKKDFHRLAKRLTNKED